MLVIPAIDILGGRCVRLVRSDYAHPTIYSDEPAKVAASFAEAGAERTHVVDLDGAPTCQRDLHEHRARRHS
ncbi:MAG: HisA/HisF-related TIM barrel protein [Candidatus Dormiibacterota bacterium]